MSHHLKQNAFWFSKFLRSVKLEIEVKHVRTILPSEQLLLHLDFLDHATILEGIIGRPGCHDVHSLRRRLAGIRQ